MTPADAGAPLTHGEGGFVAVAHRGLRWLGRQLPKFGLVHERPKLASVWAARAQRVWQPGAEVWLFGQAAWAI